MTVYPSELKEMMRECCNVGCNQPATHRVFWPGQGAKEMCDEHMAKAKRIADAMGFSLHVHALND